MINWPEILPPLTRLEGYVETPPKNVLRTQMDAGPAKLRRRFTAGVRPVQGRLLLDRDEIEFLDSFYQNDLAAGSLPFASLHPRTGLAASFRFVEPPAYTRLSGLYYEAALSLEILP
jgi:hypothetical protein